MRVAALVALSVGLGGCHALFGLDKVSDPDPVIADAAVADVATDASTARDAPIISTCGTGFGAVTTKSIGHGVGTMFDTFLSSDGSDNSATHTDKNFGKLPYVLVCRDCGCGGSSPEPDCESVDSGSDDTVGLFRFDLSGQIPMCSYVTSATLSVSTNDDNLDNTAEVGVFRVLESWDEGTSTNPNGMIGTANWINRTPQMTWSGQGVGGASRSSGEAGNRLKPHDKMATFSTLLNREMVQAWVDEPTTNHGIVLTVVVSTSDVHFYSNEEGESDRRPLLTIMYKPPM